MNQLELENQIKAIAGYKFLYLRAEDFRDFDASGKPILGSGRVQIYAIWIEAGGLIKNHRLDVLVLGKGTPQEVAEPYIPLSQFEPVETPFRNELLSKLPAYQAAHAEVEKVTIDSCNEVHCIAVATAYEYDSGANLTTAVKKVVYKVNDALTIRNLKTA